MGIYCAQCHEWIARTTYKNMLEHYNRMEKEGVADTVALRKIRKRSGTTTMRCGSCGCLLYSSLFPRVQGQFNLLHAEYCPECGKKLL